ncbi:FAD-binding protein [Muribaculaceae bacterium Isolate-083 (Janvier)]|uniref:NAD(P)/FAD-dependent oxidoreductase n=1 Tax=Duncaniella muris TaxID=2094150 RepID=UPI000F46D035|nr:FAD-binding protein [Duncaniella muris]ROS95500.1 FAD-binding protein [Muribaculaceae bacterium Isolate-083 (Janvier)]ROS96021.1 FAD-binding protein [Muribaculaceae bacterium Isolate-077 (Janvier)]ROS99517.1 FAD-binding protein [Muribaculaceae bacterium Isolate-084 (Janvier)]
MQETLDLRVTPRVAAEPHLLCLEVARLAGVSKDSVRHVLVTRRSIDARQRQVMVNLSVRAYIDEEPSSLSLVRAVDYRSVASDAPQAIVVGAGPAGLFAALRLIEEGVRPIVLERGKDVDSRRPDMADIARKGVVDPDSNYCFGEGGAGAFSDGKLYTRSKKRGSVDKILNIFAQHGASENILVDAHPHIGTDKLPGVIKAMRETICRCGGEVRFSTRVTELIIERDEVRGVVTAGGEKYFGPVILATGHSARDVYRFLLSAGVTMEPKGLAVGVRLEHPQHLIDCLRYHSKDGRGRYLPAAEYTMLTRVDDRGVYSFCMCPGGVVIPSASGPEQLAVNGMSGSARSSRWANAAMVVEVLPEDIPTVGTDDDPEGILKMLRFQESIEKAFWQEAGQTQNAPAQRMADFVNGRPSSSLPQVSYAPGAHPARIDKLLPKGIARRLQLGFKDFDRKNRGFLTNDAVLIGAETRTSSPLRIPRDNESLRHITLKGLYPCGEGAGYAGGIVSAAIDGDRSAAAVADDLNVS